MTHPGISWHDTPWYSLIHADTDKLMHTMAVPVLVHVYVCMHAKACHSRRRACTYPLTHYAADHEGTVVQSVGLVTGSRL
jgi:hypothetical protein